MESSRIGYSSAGKNNDYIVVFEISLPHNLHRKVNNKWNALYRCKKAYPLMIIHKETGKRVEEIESAENADLVYKINTLSMVEEYDYSDNVKGAGIYFYLSRNPAYFHNYRPKSGLCMKWSPDGDLIYKAYRDSNKKLIGECIKYHPASSIPSAIINYDTGIMKRFDLQGNQVSLSHYKDNKLDGLFTKYVNGSVKFTCEYKEGKKHGKYFTYHNGKKDGEMTYENNIVNGPFKLWGLGGELYAEGEIKNGKLDGFYERYKNGKHYREKYKDNRLISTIKTRKIPNK